MSFRLGQSDAIGRYAENTGIEYRFTARLLQRTEHVRSHSGRCDMCGRLVGKQRLIDCGIDGFRCTECADE